MNGDQDKEIEEFKTDVSNLKIINNGFPGTQI